MSTEAWCKKNIGKIRRYRRDWYAKNSDHAKAKVTGRRQELKQWFKELKSDMKCNRCLENNPACLDFHHINKDKKNVNIFNAVHRGWSKQRILKEIAKCEILCANCHRKEHHSKFFD